MFAMFGKCYLCQYVRRGVQWLIITATALLLGNNVIQAENTSQPISEVRTLYPREAGIEYAQTLSYSAVLNQFYSFAGYEPSQSTTSGSTVIAYTPYDVLTDSAPLRSVLTGVPSMTQIVVFFCWMTLLRN
jgi:hypothetical protein